MFIVLFSFILAILDDGLDLTQMCRHFPLCSLCIDGVISKAQHSLPCAEHLFVHILQFLQDNKKQRRLTHIHIIYTLCLAYLGRTAADDIDKLIWRLLYLVLGHLSYEQRMVMYKLLGQHCALNGMWREQQIHVLYINAWQYY